MIHAADALYQDAAWIAYHFHWTLDDILDLDHLQRRRFVDEIARLVARSEGR